MTAIILGFINKIPGWIYATAIAVLLAMLTTSGVKLAYRSSELSTEIAAHANTKLEQANADNRSLITMSERYIILSNELAGIQAKGTQNEKDLKDARNKLSNYTNGLRIPPTADELERDFRAAGYSSASAYAAGIENVYRACRKEYIDLGIGAGGAAEAANAAYAQKSRADAVVRALPPVRPLPPTK